MRNFSERSLRRPKRLRLRPGRERVAKHGEADFGEMSEWLKERAWKVRIPQKGIVGSNPAFSAEKNCVQMQFFSDTPPERRSAAPGPPPERAGERGMRMAEREETT